MNFPINEEMQNLPGSVNISLSVLHCLAQRRNVNEMYSENQNVYQLWCSELPSPGIHSSHNFTVKYMISVSQFHWLCMTTYTAQKWSSSPVPEQT